MIKRIIGNWKMHGDAAMAHPLTEAIAEVADKLPPTIEVILCPPTILLSQVAHWLIGSAVKLGGQDCHIQPEGAYTGDISAPMLEGAGCSYVIVGHSERRQYHKESNDTVRQKAARAMKTGMIPIICIGETEAERTSGKTEEILGLQVRECLPEEAKPGNFVLAYEPVWAIGSGKTPTSDDIRQIHGYIASVTSKRSGIPQDKVSVVYGGSVNTDNAQEILATEGVSGVLVGGASLKAELFSRIIAAAV